MRYQVRVHDELDPESAPYLDEEVEAADTYGALLEADMGVLQGVEASITIKLTVKLTDIG